MVRAMVSLLSAATLTLFAGSPTPQLAVLRPAPPTPLDPASRETRFLSSEAISAALSSEAVSAALSSGAVLSVLPSKAAPAATNVPHSEVTESAAVQAEGIPREFYFSRVAYTGYGRGFRSGRSWATDYPKADQIFLSFIDRLLANLDAYEREHPVRLDDPGIRRFPYLYALEVGRMALTQPEIEGLHSYLMAGGFLVIDDFWGTYEWANFEYQMQLVLPGYSIVDLPLEHPIFTTFYEIEEIMQVPNVRNGVNGWPTHEGDGIIPMVKGIHDKNGRLMVVINFNTDLGDAWEWADNPYYPLKYSTYAYEMGVNMVVYAMSH
jgi:hypothetical protein